MINEISAKTILRKQKKINSRSKAVVSFSFSTIDDKLGRLLEPGASAPSARLDTIKRFKDSGFSCGMYLMPVVPFLTDSAEMIEASVAAAQAAGVDFIIFSGMTLKPGRQKDHFMKFISEKFPELLSRYEKMYGNNDFWGAPNRIGAMDISKVFDKAATACKIPKRIPPEIWSPLVNTDEQITIMLEQLGYLADLKGLNNPYSKAAWTLSKSELMLENCSRQDLTTHSGIGDFTAGIILEIVASGNSAYYNKLL